MEKQIAWDGNLAMKEGLEWIGRMPGHGKRVLFQAQSRPGSRIGCWVFFYLRMGRELEIRREYMECESTGGGFRIVRGVERSLHDAGEGRPSPLPYPVLMH